MQLKIERLSRNHHFYYRLPLLLLQQQKQQQPLDATHTCEIFLCFNIRCCCCCCCFRLIRSNMIIHFKVRGTFTHTYTHRQVHIWLPAIERIPASVKNSYSTWVTGKCAGISFWEHEWIELRKKQQQNPQKKPKKCCCYCLTKEKTLNFNHKSGATKSWAVVECCDMQKSKSVKNAPTNKNNLLQASNTVGSNTNEQTNERLRWYALLVCICIINCTHTHTHVHTFVSVLHLSIKSLLCLFVVIVFVFILGIASAWWICRCDFWQAVKAG